MKQNLGQAAVCVVGLPLAQAFSRSLKVIGFDINTEKVTQLNQQTISTELSAPDSQLPT